MSNIFRVGVIGTGNRCLDIFKGINAVEAMTIAAVSDPCPESIERAFSVLSYRPEVCESNAALLKREDIDGIIVAAPNWLHMQLAKEVLDAGKPLYLEKPMAITAAQCEEIAAHAARKGGRMMVGMQLRYSDVYMKMKRLADDGLVGDVKLLLFRALRNRFREGVGGWRLQKAKSGGMILEVSVHQLDLFNWFAGAPIKKVAAFGGKDAIYQDGELLDNALMLVEYENGVKANLQAAVFTPQGADNTGLVVVGDRGTMYHTSDEIIVKRSDGDMIRYSTSGYGRMDENAMRGFKALVQEGKAPLTSPCAGRDAVALGIFAERAIEEGRIIFCGE